MDNMEPAGLRNLYSAADAVVNLTLLHDENFGLAQVEAMGCGTPVVGTNWGGLKDTIIEGETGYKVSTVASPALGVKVDWWEGIHKIVTLLTVEESERQSFRERSWKHASEKFSFAPSQGAYGVGPRRLHGSQRERERAAGAHPVRA